ncbi:MAG: sigma 54-interacting transcriptional regulator [Deltaproteobacteria bacterium]|nr:sigma 54-interacting transcriptional regulator [Deltaproteobacteria bacterium]
MPDGPSNEPFRRWLQTVDPLGVFELLTELLPDAAVFVVNSERRIVHWSDGAEKIVGFRREEVVGEHCLKANRCQQCVVGCGIGEHGSVTDHPITLHTRDGTPLRTLKSGRAFFDSDGVFAGGIEVLHPVIDAPVQLAAAARTGGLVAEDHAMAKACRLAHVAVDTGRPVLIRGEAGCGKSAIAETICRLSQGPEAAPVVVQTDAYSGETFLRELTGQEETGAGAPRVAGAMQRADGGALLLEDVGRLGAAAEEALAHAVKHGEVAALDGPGPQKIRFRLLVTTSEGRDGILSDEGWEGLGGLIIEVPPLRQHRADVRPLIDHFLSRLVPAGASREVDGELLRVMMAHRWPGNVAQLRDVLSYAVAVAGGKKLTLGDTPAEFRALGPKAGDEAERIRHALAAAEGHLGRTAESLGMSRPTLWRKRKKYGI